MEKNRTLLAWIAKERVLELRADTAEVLFLDEDGVNLVRQADGQIQPLVDFHAATLGPVPFPEDLALILEEIERLESVLRRWMKIEVLFGETIFSVLRAVSFFSDLLRQNGVKRVVFGTGSPHHLDSVCLSVACQINQIEQIFLYPTVFETTLVPIRHAGFLERSLGDRVDRKSVDGNFLVADFVGRMGSLLDPNVGPALPYSGSSLVSFFRLVLDGARGAVRGVLRPKAVFPPFVGHNTLSLVRALVRHRAYLTTLKSMTRREIISDSCGKIIYFGHLEPESTCFPEGLPWKSQLEYLVALRQAYPRNEIYFREHPASWRFHEVGGFNRLGLFRSRNFLRELEYFNITPIDDISGLVNSEGCFVAATLVGTVAIEESLRGRKSLVGGTAWYQGLPGAIEYVSRGFEADKVLCNCHPAEEVGLESFEFLASTLSDYGIPNSEGIGRGGVASQNGREAFVSGLRRLVES